MRTLKKSIWSYMYKVTFALVSVILISIMALNIVNEQSRAQGSADKIFEQMDKMLEENQKELTRLRQEPVFRRSTRKFPSFSSCHFFISFPASRFFLYLQQIFNALLGHDKRMSK